MNNIVLISIMPMIIVTIASALYVAYCLIEHRGWSRGFYDYKEISDQSFENIKKMYCEHIKEYDDIVVKLTQSVNELNNDLNKIKKEPTSIKKDKNILN